jgi:hypothetical protein
VLVALLLPAVQAAREAARRSTCSNNQRQIALGMHEYHDTYEKLPASSYCTPANTIGHCHSWMESLMPFIEQKATFDLIDFSVWNHQGNNPAVLNAFKPKFLMCPSDPDAGMFPNTRETGYTPNNTALTPNESLGASYIPCMGPVHMNLCVIPAMTPNINCKSSVATPRLPRTDDEAYGMFNGGWRAMNFAAALDGTSNTILLGETLPIYSSFNMYFVSHAQCASTNIPLNYHKTYTACPKSRGSRLDTCYAYMGGYKSQHPGGVLISMTDASVRFLPETVDYTVYQYMGGRDEGMVFQMP